MRLDGVMIWVQDVPATVAFYERAFGLTVQMMDDTQQFAMMSTGETTLQFADERAAVATGVSVRANRSSEQAAASQLAFVADDVAAAYERAVAAGAVAEVPLVEKPWGQTLGYLRDLNGCLVELSSPSAW
ncbi:VOC family protein [uncultured Friedmanniella sp.]|uniref:VOC family protein n=1 Tax=uncultured Friedmanniella sp. TaxID=335381 RepID=UPI0035C96F8E